MHAMNGISTVKTAVASVLCQPLVGRVVARVLHDRITTAGCDIDTSHAAISPAIKASLFWGLYESAEIRFVRRYLRPDLDVVELGSSLGVVSCHIRRILAPERRLICVEADSSLLPVLTSTLKRNACDANLTIVTGAIDYAAAGDQNTLFLPGSTSIAGRLAHARDAGARVRVRSLTLSGVLRRGGIDGPYALVCDIEGAEAGMVIHETAALARCRQLLIELHPATIDDAPVEPDDLLDRLVRLHGFRLRDRRGPVCVLER
jgi:FkbM family methyltransferase